MGRILIIIIVNILYQTQFMVHSKTVIEHKVKSCTIESSSIYKVLTNHIIQLYITIRNITNYMIGLPKKCAKLISAISGKKFGVL